MDAMAVGKPGMEELLRHKKWGKKYFTLLKACVGMC